MYEFKCPRCDARRVSSSREYPPTCYECFEHMRRVFSFSVIRPMPEHMNTSLGKPISSPRQFKNELAQKSEEMSERLGMTVNYQPVDLTDKQALGVTDEGLDTTYDRAKQEGRPWPLS